MNWLLFLKFDGEGYRIIESGSNIVPTEEYDKVLPTTERIARQSDKVYFDGEQLKLNDGETLLSVDELNNLNNSEEMNISNENTKIYDIQ